MYIMSTSPWEQCMAEHEKGIVRPECDQFESWTPLDGHVNKFSSLKACQK